MDISIKKPCHENWDNMTPNEQGAFCHKCVKSVVDFSEKTIEEIKAYFAKKSEERVCGRFREDQMTELSFDAFFQRFKKPDAACHDPVELRPSCARPAAAVAAAVGICRWLDPEWCSARGR